MLFRHCESPRLPACFKGGDCELHIDVGADVQNEPTSSPQVHRPLVITASRRLSNGELEVVRDCVRMWWLDKKGNHSQTRCVCALNHSMSAQWRCIAMVLNSHAQPHGLAHWRWDRSSPSDDTNSLRPANTFRLGPCGPTWHHRLDIVLLFWFKPSPFRSNPRPCRSRPTATL